MNELESSGVEPLPSIPCPTRELEKKHPSQDIQLARVFDELEIELSHELGPSWAIVKHPNDSISSICE